MQQRMALASAAVLLVLPRLASACAVCFGDGSDDWTAAYVAGTIMMLALPPSIIACAGIVIWRATKRQEQRLGAADSESPAP